MNAPKPRSVAGRRFCGGPLTPTGIYDHGPATTGRAVTFRVPTDAPKPASTKETGFSFLISGWRFQPQASRLPGRVAGPHPSVADPCTIERRNPGGLSRGVGAVLPWVPIAVNKVRPAGQVHYGTGRRQPSGEHRSPAGSAGLQLPVGGAAGSAFRP